MKPLKALPHREHWNAAGLSFPVDLCIHELFEDQVARTPDAAAIVFDGIAISYAELNERAAQLARCLIDLGVGPDDRVAIALERGIEMIVALLATLKAGGAYVPLDPAYPAERLAFMIEDSAPCVLLTQEAVATRFDCLPEALPVLALDAKDPPRAALSNSNPQASPRLSPANLAYVIYTSGSTGAPKGVMVEHRSLVHSTLARVRFYKKYEKFLLLSPISFDSSVAGIFGTLTCGGCLFMPKAGVALDPVELIDQINACGITSLLCVPSLLNVLLDVHNPDAGSPLHQIIVAGESCPPSLIDRVTRLLPNAKLYNEYGPTENTVWATVHFCSGDRNVSIVPIGRPIENTRIHILDRRRKPVPAGAVGELYIGGAGVARGYLNRPELTAERFLPDPFSAAPPGAGRPAHLYRTGDLGRWLPDGTIEFLGRIDYQVKIRGYRIELGEIEAAVLKYPGVREAIVLAREDRPGEKHLVAYFTGNCADVSISALRTQMAGRLPEYMVPAAYVHLDSFPLTPNGKLDRNALPPVPSLSPAGAAGQLRSSDEMLLCRLFARVTGQAAVDVNSDFFAIGGDSLGAMVLATELRQLGRDLPLANLFDARTPAAIAATWSLRTRPGAAPIRPSLFIIPGAGGDEPGLAALCFEWADQFECITLDYPDWPRLAAADFGMDDLVADLARRILERAPAGPLLLAGYSLGGFVAWALANHMAEKGQPMDVLLILDADASEPVLDGRNRHPLPVVRHTWTNRLYHRLHVVATVLCARDSAEGERLLGKFIAYCIIDHPWLLRLLGRLRHWRLPPRLRYGLSFTLRANLQIKAAGSSPTGKYAAPKPLNSTEVVFFQASEHSTGLPRGPGWPPWCRKHRTEKVAGDHWSMLSKRGPDSLYKRLPETIVGWSEATDAPPD
jgi:amino acid adenylation domain-containing protein